ncbi:unnamed protein product [Prorocentrum cordatum]|uniref:VWFA domain-containing protein n=1 Tax=Prorocentrum cordatum TaxID=2364126 RepID=A0ABN9TU10_9DINO|nr:unnamed protein product [Polarella glacialis]
MVLAFVAPEVPPARRAPAARGALSAAALPPAGGALTAAGRGAAGVEAALCAGAAIGALAAAASRRRGQGAHGERRLRAGAAVRAAAANAKEGDGVETALEIAKAVLLALLDVFKGPPEEPTGKDAPGLAALAPGGVAGALAGCCLQDVRTGVAQDAAGLVAASGRRTAVFFLTHFGDFNSWEVAQQVRTALRLGQLGGARAVLVGIGTPESGRKFAEMLELPGDLELYADLNGACAQKLGFSKETVWGACLCMRSHGAGCSGA